MKTLKKLTGDRFSIGGQIYVRIGSAANEYTHWYTIQGDNYYPQNEKKKREVLLDPID